MKEYTTFTVQYSKDANSPQISLKSKCNPNQNPTVTLKCVWKGTLGKEKGGRTSPM